MSVPLLVMVYGIGPPEDTRVMVAVGMELFPTVQLALVPVAVTVRWGVGLFTCMLTVRIVSAWPETFKCTKPW